MKNKRGYVQIGVLLIIIIILFILFSNVNQSIQKINHMDAQVVHQGTSELSPVDLLLKINNPYRENVKAEIEIKYDENRIYTDNYYLRQNRNIELRTINSGDSETYSIRFTPKTIDFWNHTESVEITVIYNDKIVDSQKVYLNEISLFNKIEALLS